MSTKLDARQRKEIQQHRERMARARGEFTPDRVALSVGWAGVGAIAGLVAVAVCVLLGVAP